MFAAVLIGAKAVAVIAGLVVLILGSGYLGFEYGSSVEKKAQAALAAAEKDVTSKAQDIAKKL